MGQLNAKNDFFYKEIITSYWTDFVLKPSLSTKERNGGSTELQNSNAEPVKKLFTAISCITEKIA